MNIHEYNERYNEKKLNTVEKIEGLRDTHIQNRGMDNTMQ